VGQYLRAHNANYGIYLLFHNGKKPHWTPDGQPPRDWEGLLSDLQALADHIREQRKDIERLVVIGIDVRTPDN
jgi:ribosomal protein S15P/S13E